MYSIFWPADGTPAAQINKIISHPTVPILVTAHEDKYIKMFDLSTGESPVLDFFNDELKPWPQANAHTLCQLTLMP